MARLKLSLAQLSLEQLARGSVETIPLEVLALAVAKTQYPDVETSVYLQRLDEFASRARPRIEGVAGPTAIAGTLSHYLFEEEGFRGNGQDYYNPSNSLLNDVLDQRAGMPLTLSILYIAIGRRLGLPVSGVAFPGHFLVHYQNGGDAFYVDAFAHGKLLSREDCMRRLNDRYGPQLPPRPEFFDPASHRDILLRLLTNLKVSYLLRKDYEGALGSLTHSLLFRPEGAEDMKERGLVYLHLECFQPALKDLEGYLLKKPGATDRKEIEACLLDLREKISHIS